ncbi:hypothetical protein [Photobacterium phosphoreum]|uniref:hypothetical protein n=1 Tax=Photobacterium phosphoreum TaxID=659 RepID=UPI001E41F45F|nr:hypothetical protein [Photobacterium phosphoreum]
MSYKVRKLENDEQGTHYGIFINELLIHYVFNRTRALEIVKELENGKILIDVIAVDIIREEQRKCQKLLDIEKAKAGELAVKLFQLNKQLSQLKWSEKSKKLESIDLKPAITIMPKGTKDKTLLFMSVHHMNKTEASELVALIQEVKSKGFKYSKELSSYIMKNQLKRKYPHISGVVKMEKSGEQWDFSGGFPKKIYGIVCKELGLSDQGTTAKAVGFTSFKEMGGLF